jgi:hypothetical protein
MKKKRKTIKYKDNSIMDYQYGGLTLPFLDKYNNLNKQWDSAWKSNPWDMINNTVKKGNWTSQNGTDPVKAYTDPNSPYFDIKRFQSTADKDTPILTGPGAGTTIPAGSTIYNNNYWQSQYNHSAPNHNDYVTALNNDIKTNVNGKFEPIKQEDVFNDHVGGIFSGLNYLNAYKPEKPIDLQEGFQGVQYAQKGATVKPIKKGKYIKTFKNDPEYFNNRIFEEWQKKALATGQVGIDDDGTLYKLNNKVDVPQEWLDITSGNYDKSNTKEKYQAEARQQQAMLGLNQFYNNPLTGLMGAGLAGPGKSTLHYLAKQAGEELISKNLNTYKDSLQYQDGGSVNTTGYTPGTPTANNKINIIPGSEGTMEGVQEDLIAIGRNGADKGLIKKLDKTTPQFRFKSDSFLELPINKPEQQPDVQYAQTGAAILNRPEVPNRIYYTPTWKQQLDNDPKYINPYGYDETTGRGMDLSNLPDPEDPYGFAAANPTVVPTSTTPTTPSTVYKLRHDSVYDYTQDANGNWLTRRKNSKGDWIDMKTKLSPEKYNDAIKLIETGKYTESKTPSGATRTTKKVGTSPTASIHALMPIPEDFAPKISKDLTPTLTSINAKDNLQKTGKKDTTPQKTKSKFTDINVDLGGISDWLPSFGVDGEYTPEKYLPSKSKLPKYGVAASLIKAHLASRKPWNNAYFLGKPVSATALNRLNQIGFYQYGGYIPNYQFGGEINNDYAYPIHPITEEFTDIQTEKGEVATLPDGTIVDVKATEKHKDMDKNHITDILPGKSHVFSHDPKMKLNLDSSIGGVKIKDMKLGKTTFEYKENQITAGPKDVMLSEIWGDKKELTPAELVNNVKKKFELRDNKNNFLTQRANEENKEQRLLYIDVIKAFSEYKKPKTKREIPQAQYGMQLPTMNVGLPNVYNQPTNTAIDGMLGYNNKALDPYSNMDNTMKSMYNVSSAVSPKLYEDGGDIPHAQLGKLLRYTSPVAFLGSEFFANRAKTRQERENEILNAERTKYANDMQNTVDTSGRIGIGTNLATYMAGLNVPRQLYDDQSEQLALVNDHFRRRNADLQAQKYSQLNSLGSAGSLARYTNPNNMGQYLAASQQGYNQNVGSINSQIGSLEDQKVQNIMNLLSKRNEGYNASENAFRNQLYNVNVQGIGNTGRSLQEATLNSGDTRYRLGMEKMAYDEYLKEKAQGARDKVIGDWEGALDSVGQLAITAATGGFGNLAGLGGSNNSNSSFVMGTQNPNMPNFYNPKYTSSANLRNPGSTNTAYTSTLQYPALLSNIFPLPIFGNRPN